MVNVNIKIDLLVVSIYKAAWNTPSNSGTMLTSAFSISHTQKLLYELKNIGHENKQKVVSQTHPRTSLNWAGIDININTH
ncbi:MAG: hypothetical protein HWE24_07775 [Oceanospirillaceae bacterium]|nr:hypothetical protein [Oceanospirillaceae bacterium]